MPGYTMRSLIWTAARSTPLPFMGEGKPSEARRGEGRSFPFAISMPKKQPPEAGRLRWLFIKWLLKNCRKSPFCQGVTLRVTYYALI